MTYIEPLLLLVLLAVTFTSLFRRFRWTAILSFLSIAALWTVTTPLFPVMFLRSTEKSLETSGPPANWKPAENNAIVVLASSVDPPPPGRDEAILGADTRERCVYAAELFHKVPGMFVITTGGGGAWVPGGSYAAAMKHALIEEGVPAGAVVLEPASHSTRENAVNSASLLASRGVRTILLVTSAFHMTRAAACFRRLGIRVIPCACDFRIPSQMCWRDWLPSASWIAVNDALLHEFAGSVFYRSKGWI